MIHEFYITVANEHRSTDEWISCCEQLSIKPMIIRLRKGKHTEQFMCSAHLSTHDWQMAEEYLHHLNETLDACGFDIKRNKIEIPIYNTERWLEFNSLAVVYHETHIKIQYQPGKMDDIFTALSRHDCAISHSILNGNLWVTKRLPSNMSASEASIRFQQLKSLIINNVKAQVIEVRSETAVYDDNSKLDEGWLINTY